MLEGQELKKQYGNLEVLKGVTLSIQAGELVSIVGSSGAGKSTLLHLLGTLDQADEGKIYFLGEEISSYKPKALNRFRNKHIGFVFQFHHLLPEFSAIENVSIPAWIDGRRNQATQHRAAMLLDLLGLKDRMHHKPNQLSGGEQQRVAVARALMNEPAIIMADEPTGNLDSKNAADLHAIFKQLSVQNKQTFLIVTHNEALANMSDRKLMMKDGLII